MNSAIAENVTEQGRIQDFKKRGQCVEQYVLRFPYGRGCQMSYILFRRCRVYTLTVTIKPSHVVSEFLQSDDAVVVAVDVRY